MADDKIIQFPTKSKERRKNRLGKRAVPCLISDRWLQFAKDVHPLKDGDYVFLDVMTRANGEKERKICQLCVSKQDVIAAIEALDAKRK
jgi:hypothetical protein